MKSRHISIMLTCCLSLFGLNSYADSYTQTQYPIILVHGAVPFLPGNQLPAGGAEAGWFLIPDALRAGGATVYATITDGLNSSEIRGEQLIVQLDDIRGATGATKFNLIGHSHGAPTSRYVASTRPDLVASVTTIGGVNAGSPGADVALALGTATTPEQLASFTSLSTAGMNSFNASHPDGVPSNSSCAWWYGGYKDGAHNVNGIAYYSWSGTAPSTNVFDALDVVTVAGSLLFLGAPNDGLVGRCASRLGNVIKSNYFLNHFDEVNLTAGLVGLFSPNQPSLYRQHANRLKQAGL